MTEQRVLYGAPSEGQAEGALLRADIEAARRLVSGLCASPSAWRVSIPVQPGDSDELLTRVIDAAERLQRERDEARAEVERLWEWRRACPVCGGRGIVPAGFYATTWPLRSTTTDAATGEQCRTCRGTAVYPPAILATPPAGEPGEGEVG